MALIVDLSSEQTLYEVKQFTREYSMTLRILEESTQCANLAEN